jgi:hypothetical protein
MISREVFDRCWPYLEPAVAAYGPTHSKDDVWQRIESGEAQLWPLPHAAMVTELKRWPTGFKEAVAWLAGGSLVEIREFTPALEAWAKAEGCDRAAVCAGRLGWSRALTGYRQSGAFLTKEL